MEAMDAAARIERMIAPALDDMGYELVRVQLSGGTSAFPAADHGGTRRPGGHDRG